MIFLTLNPLELGSIFVNWVFANPLWCGAWVVYKFMFPLKKGIKAVMAKKMGTYNTMHEARNETLKPLTRDHGFSPEPSWERDEHGAYWIIRIVTSAFEIIFVPVREDFFDGK